MAGGCYFYATRKDMLSILDFIFTSTELEVYEAYSRIGHLARSFDSLDGLLEVGPDNDHHGRLHLQAHSHKIYPGNIVNQIQLNASAGGGIRYSIESPAAILVLEAGFIKNDSGRYLDSSRIACLTEAGARQRSSYPPKNLDAVDWKLLASTFAKIERHIRRNLAATRWSGRIVLQDAEHERSNGNILLWPQT